MAAHDVVIHLASNPDIAGAMTEPAIDFHEGTLLTHNVVEAMRRTGAPRILYASGSGVYGDLGELEASEDQGPLVPVSTYGASKLAGEALICSYAHMFGIWGRAFRFGNVVGPRQTHGVGLRLLNALLATPPGCASWATAARPSRTSTSRTSSPPCSSDDAGGDAPFSGLQRRHRRLHHRAGDRRAGRGRAWASPRQVRWFTGGGRGAGRATSRSCASTPTASAPGLALRGRLPRGAIRPRSRRCSTTCERPGPA